MPLGNRRFGNIGVYRGCTNPDQNGEMMNIKTFATGHIDRCKCAQLLSDKMRMNRACCQNHWDWNPTFRRISVGQHHMLAT